jgi:uncharacterized protein (TIGR01777 family)
MPLAAPRRGEGLRIAVAGASGFLGAALVPLLQREGHVVITIGRPHRGRLPDVVWDPARGKIDRQGLQGIDAAINLTGERIDQRWTADARERILGSRVKSTAVLARAMAELSPRPRVLVNMSAVGYYGDTGDTLVDEQAPKGKGFLASVVEAWEHATRPAADAGIRVVLSRAGVVLHPSGSILARLVPIFRMGGGGRIGSGRQWISWIARTDLARALYALVGDESLGGVVNVTSPEPVRNETFVETLARVLHRPTFASVPSFAVKMLYGAMGEETVLAGQRVYPRRLVDAGFEFSAPELEPALRHEMARAEAAGRPPRATGDPRQ